MLVSFLGHGIRKCEYFCSFQSPNCPKDYVDYHSFCHIDYDSHNIIQKHTIDSHDCVSKNCHLALTHACLEDSCSLTCADLQNFTNDAESSGLQCELSPGAGKDAVVDGDCYDNDNDEAYHMMML